MEVSALTSEGKRMKMYLRWVLFTNSMSLSSVVVPCYL